MSLSPSTFSLTSNLGTVYAYCRKDVGAFLADFRFLFLLLMSTDVLQMDNGRRLLMCFHWRKRLRKRVWRKKPGMPWWNLMLAAELVSCASHIWTCFNTLDLPWAEMRLYIIYVTIIHCERHLSADLTNSDVLSVVWLRLTWIFLLIIFCLEAWRTLEIFQSLFVCAGDEPADYWLSDLCGQLSAVVASKPAERLAAQVGEFALCTVRADK